MAAQVIDNPRDYLGTNAERIAMALDDVKAGSGFYETDTKAVYIFDGTAWVAM